jgi:segregation and condensation protein A
MAKVSVREQAALLRVRLAESGRATFAELVADCEHTTEVVARFLALLDLYKEAVVAFRQDDALAELHVNWTGGTVEDAAAAAAAVPTDEEEYG